MQKLTLKLSMILKLLVNNMLVFLRNKFICLSTNNTRFIPPLNNVKSIDLDGTDEYLHVSDHVSLDQSTAITASIWVKGPAGDPTGIIGKMDLTLNKREWYLMRDFSATDKACLVCSLDGSFFEKYYITSITVFDNTWHHLAFTFNNGTVKMYVDGNEDTSVVKSQDDACLTLFNGNAPLVMGTLWDNGAHNETYTKPMSMDEASIFSVALSDAEISTLYNSGAPTNLVGHSKYSSLVSWWRMGDLDDSITTIKDRKGSNHATPTNMESGDIVSDAP